MPILVAGRLYQRILLVIERHDYDVLRRRATTSRLEKAWVAWLSLADAWRPGQAHQGNGGDR